ncbi:RNA-binding S4 domain-containing protein [Peptoniphilus equinus]|uniref:RQC P-site tRNA stabilizing factor n=1 Tax=Peptoniphilus equinus TaxID=3016343 RepID=A0ABY7QT86_9FIRM|nr:RNA-binding S4 domain-containing protein [Peptoniphilus equinus]WBW49500.1 RNA-binding S4 domain-containing protein [Peptoniphilus equinus]
MRLDKFLKVSRIIVRRSVAKMAAEGGHITINGKVAKPSAEVEAGDLLTIEFGTSTRRIEVLDIKDHVKKDEADSLYKILD